MPHQAPEAAVRLSHPAVAELAPSVQVTQPLTPCRALPRLFPEIVLISPLLPSQCFAFACFQGSFPSVYHLPAACFLSCCSHMLPPVFSGYTLSLEHFSPALLLLFPTKHDFTPEFQTALQTFTRLQFFGVMSWRKHPLSPGTLSPFLSHGEDENKS